MLRSINVKVGSDLQIRFYCEIGPNGYSQPAFDITNTID
jgi:hypothetical protein